MVIFGKNKSGYVTQRDHKEAPCNWRDDLSKYWGAVNWTSFSEEELLADNCESDQTSYSEKIYVCMCVSVCVSVYL